MTDKDSDSQQAPAANTVDAYGRPPPYSSELPPPYLQQPGYQGPSSFQAPPAYQILPGYQGPPCLQSQPSYEIPPGYYQGLPAYQSLPNGYPRQVCQGAPNDSVIASHPGSYVIQPTSMQNTPSDYQVLSWFACLCCCWPLGIVAILKSNEVRSSLSRGDFNSARIASNSARNFAYTAIGLGTSFIVMYIIAMILVFTMFLSGKD